ncbi:MAG: hypothetical protein P1V35_01260 [Planctomycetota bacterium]|nr:hypothetical protein [Planctomycetota bacterium]
MRHSKLATAFFIPLALVACNPDKPAQADPGNESDPGVSQVEGQNPGPARDSYGIPLDAPVGEDARKKVGELMEVFRLLDPTLTSDHHDQQIFEQRAIYKELIAAGPEVGHAALQAYTGANEEDYLVRRALLWVGGKAAPKEAEALMATMMVTYGIEIGDRTEATLILAEIAPERYMEIATPFLQRRENRTKTMPDDEFLVRGWVNACKEANTSPVSMLADVATNLRMMPNARYLAAKRIGDFPNEVIGQRALEVCLIESSGDDYLRRMAAQSLEALLPRESACELFRDVLSKEASIAMAHFLESLIQKNCR